MTTTIAQLCRPLLFSLVASASLAMFPSPAPAETVDRDKIAKTIAQLGDADFKTREDASRALWNLGHAAEPALKEALKSQDPEIASRAGEILTNFKYGLYPDTPPEIAKLVRAYREGEWAEKREAIVGLECAGRLGFPALARLWNAESDEQIKKEIFNELSSRASETVPAFLADGDFAVAEQLLDAAATGGTSIAARTYAAYYALHGGFAQKIGLLRDEIELDGNRVQCAERLTYLQRALGDLRAARQAAEKSHDSHLIEGILFELHDWNALAEHQQSQPRGAEDIEGMGFLAAYQRLSGRGQQFEKTLAQIRAYGDRNADAYRDAVDALFLNDRPAAAIELLGKKGQSVAVFELLAAQQRYSEALALATKVRQAKQPDASALDLLAAPLLQHLGEQAECEKILKRLRDEANATADIRAWANLIEAESRAGMIDTAFEHCGAALALQRTREGPGQLLSKVFPGKALPAEIWWNLLREKSGDEKPAQTLSRVREILDGKLPAADLEKLATDGARNAVMLRRDLALRVIGETLEAAGRHDAAAACFQSLAQLPSGNAGLLALGELALKQKNWTAAADYYGRALRRDSTHVIARYMRGYALARSGQEKQGREIQDRAELMALADDRQRYELAEALRKNGLTDDARKQYQMLARTGEFMSWELGNAVRVVAREAYGRGEYLTAADLWEQTTLDVLHSNTSFKEQSTYLTIPHLIHKSRALGLLAAGKPAEAWKEIQLCLDYLPADIDTPIELLPALTKAGRTTEADELFARILKTQKSLCEQYPSSSLCQNSLAWLCARCGRELDLALAHALRAVELEPKNCAVIDTLAETYFQRNEKEKAIQTMQKCVELEPNVSRHREQIKRFETKPPQSEPPP